MKWLSYLPSFSLLLFLLTYNIKSEAQTTNSVQAGKNHIDKEEYLTAFNILLRVSDSLESIHAQTNDQAYAWMYLAICYEYFDYDESTISYLNRSLVLFRQTKNKKGEALCLSYLGDIIEDMGQTEQALAGYETALAYFKQNGTLSEIAMVYDNIASSYENLQKYDSATFFLNKALTLYSKNKDTIGLCKVLNNYGDVYRRWGKPQKSLIYYQQSLAYARLLHRKEEERSNLKDISKTLADLGRYKEAYGTFSSFYDAHLKLKIEKKLNEISKLELQNIEYRKVMEIKAIEAEEQIVHLRLSLIAVGLATLLIILALAYYSYRVRHKKDQQLTLIRQELLEAAIKTSQIEKENLKIELASKKGELLNFTKTLIERSELIEELRKKLDESFDKQKIKESIKLKSLEELTDASILTNDDWKHFKRKFEAVHEGFFEKLLNQYPAMTTGDIRLVAVMKLRLSQSEIAAMMGISEGSVKKAKQRLKSKISANEDFKLQKWVDSIS